MYTMKASVAVAKEADAKKGVSPTRSDNSILRLRNEPERQLDTLGGVISNIRRDGGTPSIESIATHLSSMRDGERAPVLFALQRTHGNRYVQRVVAGIQAKLVVGQPGDKYEQEADRVADAVMRMPEPRVQRQVEPEEEEETLQSKPLAEGITPRVQRQVEPEEEEEELIQTKALSEQITPLVQRQEGEEEEEEIQTKPLPSQTSEVVSDVETSINSIRGGGQPLPGSTRAFFEPRFGQDFSQVRLHTDVQAADAARAVNARAFTVGHDVVFGAGRYAPGTSEGGRLMAHELTHVVQQHGSVRLQRAATPTSHEEMLDAAINIVQRALDSLIAQASENDGQPVAAGNVERDQNLRKALDNLLALKGSGKEDEILRAVQPILFTAKSNTSVANPNAAVQRKAIVGQEGDALEHVSEVVVRRVSHGCTADDLIQEVSQHSTEIIQRQGGPGEAVLVGGAVVAGPPGWAILAGIAIVGLIAGGIYLATRPRSRPCPPCPANPPPEIDRVPPSASHFPCPSDHWHYRRYNQNPGTCECFLSGRLFGGCCSWPGAPC